MLLKSALVMLSYSALALALSGCGLLGSNPTQGIGVLAKDCPQSPTSPPGASQCLPGSNLMITPYVQTWGNETGDCYGPYTPTPEYPSCVVPANTDTDYTLGTEPWFGQNGLAPLTTPENGPLVVNNAEAPAFWNLYWLMPYPCGNNSNPQLGPIYLGEVGSDYGAGDLWEMEVETGPLNSPLPNYYSTGGYGELDCYVPPPWLLPASTQFAILGSLPNTLTLSSRAPLITQYGMPLLYVYNNAGNVVDTETATAVDNNGTEATFPFPTSLTQSGYSLAIVNQTGGGVGFAPAGDNLLSIASSQTISGNPFGVSVGGQTDTYQGRQLTFPVDGPPQGVWVPISGTRYETFPVVSLYANGEVLINGTAVEVGNNPTAVAAYASGTVTTTTNNSDLVVTDTYTGSRRAIVANSGENTVSILDIVNNALLDTVTVGNQPVAVTVTPDGTTAYVANYTDGTVTEVNLNTETPVTTVAVGGQPTSVALAAPSTLWVGGVGFLTQINTQNMTVVATQSTAGETIAALGYSDAENEVIATTMNSGGGVNVDEVSPSSVSVGTPYTTVASHPISTLGTYLNPKTQTEVRGFTATISQSLVPVSTNQVGAPPLVVQDGWAVVSATPTGFTITDASGHDVLVSETTPSPIGAIAVDTNLSVAYLTMPDSNTLLTVPLPGTSGTSGTNGASGSFTVTATNNDPDQTALSLGHSMSYAINVSPTNGFVGTVALWVDGLPAGVAASLSSASITAPGNATLTLTAAYNASTFIGSSTVTVTGTSGGVAQSVAIPLTTQPLQYRGYCSVQ